MTTHLIYTTQAGAEIRVEMTDAQANGVRDALGEYATKRAILVAQVGESESKIWLNPCTWTAWRFEQSQPARVSVPGRVR